MDNPKVFPLAQNPGAVVLQDGVTLRDHFAGLAMQGFVANNWNAMDDAARAVLADSAYELADAMLAARQPQTPSEPLPEITEPAI